MSTVDRYTVIADIPHEVPGVAQPGTWAVAYSEHVTHKGPTTHAVEHGPAVYAMELHRAINCVDHATRYWNASNVTLQKVTR